MLAPRTTGTALLLLASASGTHAFFGDSAPPAPKNIAMPQHSDGSIHLFGRSSRKLMRLGSANLGGAAKFVVHGDENVQGEVEVDGNVELQSDVYFDNAALKPTSGKNLVSVDETGHVASAQLHEVNNAAAECGICDRTFANAKSAPGNNFLTELQLHHWNEQRDADLAQMQADIVSYRTDHSESVAAAIATLSGADSNGRSTRRSTAQKNRDSSEETNSNAFSTERKNKSIAREAESKSQSNTRAADLSTALTARTALSRGISTQRSNAEALKLKKRDEMSNTWSTKMSQAKSAESSEITTLAALDVTDDLDAKRQNATDDRTLKNNEAIAALNALTADLIAQRAADSKTNSIARFTDSMATNSNARAADLSTADSARTEDSRARSVLRYTMSNANAADDKLLNDFLYSTAGDLNTVHILSNHIARNDFEVGSTLTSRRDSLSQARSKRMHDERVAHAGTAAGRKSTINAATAALDATDAAAQTNDFQTPVDTTQTNVENADDDYAELTSNTASAYLRDWAINAASDRTTKAAASNLRTKNTRDSILAAIATDSETNLNARAARLTDALNGRTSVSETASNARSTDFSNAGAKRDVISETTSNTRALMYKTAEDNRIEMSRLASVDRAADSQTNFDARETNSIAESGLRSTLSMIARERATDYRDITASNALSKESSERSTSLATSSSEMSIARSTYDSNAVKKQDAMSNTMAKNLADRVTYWSGKSTALSIARSQDISTLTKIHEADKQTREDMFDNPSAEYDTIIKISNLIKKNDYEMGSTIERIHESESNARLQARIAFSAASWSAHVAHDLDLDNMIHILANTLGIDFSVLSTTAAGTDSLTGVGFSTVVIHNPNTVNEAKKLVNP